MKLGVVYSTVLFRGLLVDLLEGRIGCRRKQWRISKCCIVLAVVYIIENFPQHLRREPLLLSSSTTSIVK